MVLEDVRMDAVIVRCPNCGDVRTVTPRYGDVVAVYCLCRTMDSGDIKIPTRTEVLPAGDREPREPVPA
jgi:uncharacterized Zn finger protein